SYSLLHAILFGSYGLTPLTPLCTLFPYTTLFRSICEAFAGLAPGRADMLRRALNKQKRAAIEEISSEFIASALARGHPMDKTAEDRKSTRLNSSHGSISYAVFCLKKKKQRISVDI